MPVPEGLGGKLWRHQDGALHRAARHVPFTHAGTGVKLRLSSLPPCAALPLMEHTSSATKFRGCSASLRFRVVIRTASPLSNRLTLSACQS